MKENSVIVSVSTENGGYLLRSDENRKEWSKGRHFLSGESVNNVTTGGNRKLFASTLTEGVFSSEDLGKTWKTSSRGLHVRKVWTVEADSNQEGLLYAGTQYGHLFRSYDYGKSWEEVVGLHNAPLRDKWGIDWAFGTTGLTIHTIKTDPNKKGRMYIVASGPDFGVYSL